MKRSPMKRTYRNTGPDQATRHLVYGRDGSACCVCGGTFMLQLHHRSPRRAGGTSRPEVNSPANLVVLCQDHHAFIESRRETARQSGYLVPSLSTPADVPVVWKGAWTWLADDGTASPVLICDPTRDACSDETPCIACPRSLAARDVLISDTGGEFGGAA